MIEERDRKPWQPVHAAHADEGLFAGYESVEFLAPLKVGDFVEATARVFAATTVP